MPSNTTVLLVRHAEKPEAGPGLAVAGQERAQAYIAYFQNYMISDTPARYNYLFATADSHESCRPRLTIEPLAGALGLSINSNYADKSYGDLAKEILDHSKYNNSIILICWHHGEILNLAEALGVSPQTLPASSSWPVPPWPEDVYGWLLQISYAENGTIIPAQTFCINEQLMYNDAKLVA
jgi:hypothetical protein